MATENQKPVLEYSDKTQDQENTLEVPADSELFAAGGHETEEVPADSELFAAGGHETDPKADDLALGTQEKLSAQEAFAGDDDFYNYLTTLSEPAVTQKPIEIEKPAVTSPPEITSMPQRFSTVQKVLAASIVFIATMLLYALLKSPPKSIASLPPTSANQMAPATHQTPYSKPPVAEDAHIAPQQLQEPELLVDSTQPLSLKVAQTFYLTGDYDQALLVYEKLYQSLPASPKEDLMRDSLQLQMALCMERTADYTNAGRQLRKVLKSNSPAVRVVAYYHCSLLEMQKKQYLNARTKAYQAIALIDTIDFDKDWSLSLKRDCYFIAAQALTRKVLSLCDADKDLPEDLWGSLGAADEPFYRLNETQLRTFLNSGSQRLSFAILGPQIQKLDHQDGLPRYTVTCNGASVEELLSRFAANSDIDLRWDLAGDQIGIRKRLVYLYLPSVTMQQFVTAATGCADLLARMDDKGIVNIFNPVTYSYVSEQISLLSTEAVSLWQKFLLMYPADPRLANVHFALGLLHAPKGRITESMAEYKLVANRFSRSSLAPFALLNSSKLKNSLHDYLGGREDLKQLVEQFPDTEIAGKAHLYLADTTSKTDLKTEAARLYRKVYNLNLSSESQIAAALGAGKCSYHMGDYESAEKWLTRYIKLAEECEDLYLAYFILGKTRLALENSEAACDAFRYAIQGGPTQLGKEQYIETISALVEAYMQQGHFVQALDMLESIHSVVFSQEESIEILLLKSKALRAMGLVDNAIAILGDEAEYVPEPQLKAEICFELSECYIEKGNLNLAHKKLAEILVLTESGPLAHKIALRLAEVCLQLGQNDQATSVCSQLLNLQPSEQIKQKTLDLMAMAYSQQKNYDRAALALLGQWK